LFTFSDILQRIKENNYLVTNLMAEGDVDEIQNNMTDEEFERLGRDVAHNTHLNEVHLTQGALNDKKMSSLFRGLTRSNSIKDMNLNFNGLGVDRSCKMQTIF
jgi:hypothetical protein